MSSDSKSAKLQSAQINSVLGLFLLVFGLIVLVAIILTESFIGKMTNLVAGLVLVSVGGGMLYSSFKVKKKLKS